MDIERFLKRIGITSLPDSPHSRLREIHRAMTQSVPFENLAILEGREIDLAPTALFVKVVEQGRGGYCFELNALLAEVCESLGYKVERLLGRVWSSGAPSPPLTHMALRVMVDNQCYLCDAGFGGGTLRDPLPWSFHTVANQTLDSYRLEETDNQEVMLSRFTGSSWKHLYSVLPCPVQPQDFIPANHYTSTHPDSFFTQAPVAALTTAEGRITLRGRLFRRVEGTDECERELATFEDFINVLHVDFGLTGLNGALLERRLSGLFGKE